MKDTYLLSNELPELRPMAIATQIMKINPVNNELIKRYSTVKEVLMEHKMSRQTLYKAIDNQDIKYNALWRRV